MNAGTNVSIYTLSKELPGKRPRKRKRATIYQSEFKLFDSTLKLLLPLELSQDQPGVGESELLIFQQNDLAREVVMAQHLRTQQLSACA